MASRQLRAVPLFAVGRPGIIFRDLAVERLGRRDGYFPCRPAAEQNVFSRGKAFLSVDDLVLPGTALFEVIANLAQGDELFVDYR